MIQRNTKLKWIKILLVLEVVLVGGIIKISQNHLEMVEVSNPKSTVEPKQPIKQEKPSPVRTFADYRTLNKDYIGQLIIEDLIDLPVVQSQLADINAAYDQYLRTAFDTLKHDEEGSIFMDPNNEINDMNLVIYGHNVAKRLDPTLSHKFTPLHQLKVEKNYQKYSKITFKLENEIRYYQIVHVFYAKINTDENGNKSVEPGGEYMLPSYTDKQLKQYLNYVSKHEFYNTGIEIGSEDHFMTLQTCVEHHDDLRLVIIAKEIEG